MNCIYNVSPNLKVVELRQDPVMINIKNIDEENVHNHIPHNPLIIASEMAKIGLRVEGIYFYHFHLIITFDLVLLLKLKYFNFNSFFNDYR